MEIKSFAKLAELKKAGQKVNLSHQEVIEEANQIANNVISEIESDIAVKEIELEQLEKENSIDPLAIKLAKAKYDAAVASAARAINNEKRNLITKYNEVGGEATPKAVTDAMALLIQINTLEEGGVESAPEVREARKAFEAISEDTPEIVALQEEIADLQGYLTQIKNAAAQYLEGASESGE